MATLIAHAKRVNGGRLPSPRGGHSHLATVKHAALGNFVESRGLVIPCPHPSPQRLFPVILAAESDQSCQLDRDFFFRVGNLSGMGSNDLGGNDTTPQMEPGTISWVRDASATGSSDIARMSTLSAALALGSLQAIVSDGANVVTTTVSNITSGSTTHAITSGLTAGRHDGMICFVLDSAQGTGIAPEGEASIVDKNTATRIDFAKQYPFSTALAANDDLELIGTYQAEAAADGDEAWTIHGVVVGKNGIDAGKYGWIQLEGNTMANGGPTPSAKVTRWSPAPPSSTPSALTDRNSGSASRWPPAAPTR